MREMQEKMLYDQDSSRKFAPLSSGGPQKVYTHEGQRSPSLEVGEGGRSPFNPNNGGKGIKIATNPHPANGHGIGVSYSNVNFSYS